MNIRYFYRHPKIGFSIEKVFSVIEKEVRKSQDVKSIKVIKRNSLPWDIVINGWFTFKHRNKNGINHITGHIHDVIFGLATCKSVVTFHDLVFLDNVKNPIKKLYKWLFWVYFPVRFANRVTCISEHTKSNLLKHIKTEKITVIHNPIDSSYQFVAKEFNNSKPVILHIGTGWNKNLLHTIGALSGINCHLRIIGKLKQDQLDALERYGTDFSNAYGLTDDEIRQEYINCDIVNFPSVYEGFGMPIIEAQATGRVVLTSNLEPLNEVAGKAAHFIDPNNVDNMNEGYRKVISDEVYRKNLIAAGLENVSRFSATNISNNYLDLYRKILEK